MDATTRSGHSRLARIDGPMAAAIRARDWSALPLGPLDAWPETLVGALEIALSARFPTALFWGPNLRLLYNDEYAGLLGDKHPDALGRPASEVWSEVWGTLHPLLEAAAGRGVSTWAEDLLFTANTRGFAEEQYLTCSLSPLRGASGEVDGVFATFVRTTDRVIGERRARTIQALAEHAADARTAGEAGRIACATLALNPFDVPASCLYLCDGRTARRVSPAEPDPAHACPDSVDLDGEDPLGVAVTWRTRQIRTMPSPGAGSVVLVPVCEPGAEAPLGVLYCATSPRLPLDRSYMDFLADAGRQVAQAISSGAAHEEARHRVDELASLDQAKTTFFSNVSHEFRTPLTLLLGPLEEFLARPDRQSADGAGEVVRAAYRNAMWLLKLVNTLLDFARIESGRARAVFEPTDLASYTAELASAFGSAFEQAKLTLRLECPPLAEPVYVDREMWEKIVLNLISNALKHTTAGEIHVSLTSTERFAELRVRDTGAGIPSDELSRIFERFHMLRRQAPAQLEGTGIGLSIVHELTKLHGGSIQVDSTVGQGTTFTVAVPLGIAHLPSGQVEAAAGARPASRNTRAFVEGVVGELTPPVSPAAPGTTGSGSVVLVEDNAETRAYTARLLARRWEVRAVTTAPEALDEALRRPPDLIVSDLVMPGMDGLQLLTAIRAEPRTRTLPFILLTARAGEEAILRGLKAGVDDYLVKPFSARQLEARVASSIALSQLRKQADQTLRESMDRLARTRKMDAITKLAGGIAHDFNNLLTTILGYVSLALARALPSDLRVDLTEVQMAGKRAALLTKQLLAYGQRQTLRPRAVNFNTILAELESHLRHVTGPRIALSTKLDPQLGLTSVDRAHIEEAVVQLVINAKEAMPEGGAVTLKTQRVEVPGPYVVDSGTLQPGWYTMWSVTDTGRGMDVKTRTMSFEPFFTTKKLGHGPGLGLSAVLGVVQQTGGQIRIDSQLGQGTTVEVYLPELRGPEAPARPEAGLPERDASAAILLVEDEIPVRRYLSNLLRSRGYRIFEAHDGADALALIERVGQVDLLLTDVMMPRMDGPTLAAELSRRQPELKILFISGYTGAHVVQEGLIREEDEFLQKPFTPDELIGRIQRVIGRR